MGVLPFVPLFLLLVFLFLLLFFPFSFWACLASAFPMNSAVLGLRRCCLGATLGLFQNCSGLSWPPLETFEASSKPFVSKPLLCRNLPRNLAARNLPRNLTSMESICSKPSKPHRNLSLQNLRYLKPCFVETFHETWLGCKTFRSASSHTFTFPALQSKSFVILYT